MKRAAKCNAVFTVLTGFVLLGTMMTASRNAEYDNGYLQKAHHSQVQSVVYYPNKEPDGNDCVDTPAETVQSWDASIRQPEYEPQAMPFYPQKTNLNLESLNN